ncbi:hypothetical protein HYH03_012158 [Edaphochlamys debaryana]|uniref:Uncharacterized protein n=1 Tax=Edaphochlamys debaryana TaxID=47281 RepID=A0A836BU99_9CHLO|nr:hypothetical protein HYH03_012158 [Edaphochlamys debaryana]|eukprot:KAG2489326.1 hypothetical protein HYH03_012158 [Edaphochlamys debaryana]
MASQQHGQGGAAFFTPYSNKAFDTPGVTDSAAFFTPIGTCTRSVSQAAKPSANRSQQVAAVFALAASDGSEPSLPNSAEDFQEAEAHEASISLDVGGCGPSGASSERSAGALEAVEKAEGTAGQPTEDVEMEDVDVAPTPPPPAKQAVSGDDDGAVARPQSPPPQPSPEVEPPAVSSPPPAQLAEEEYAAEPDMMAISPLPGPVPGAAEAVAMGRSFITQDVHPSPAAPSLSRAASVGAGLAVEAVSVAETGADSAQPTESAGTAATLKLHGTAPARAPAPEELLEGSGETCGDAGSPAPDLFDPSLLVAAEASAEDAMSPANSRTATLGNASQAAAPDAPTPVSGVVASVVSKQRAAAPESARGASATQGRRASAIGSGLKPRPTPPQHSAAAATPSPAPRVSIQRRISGAGLAHPSLSPAPFKTLVADGAVTAGGMGSVRRQSAVTGGGGGGGGTGTPFLLRRMRHVAADSPPVTPFAAMKPPAPDTGAGLESARRLSAACVAASPGPAGPGAARASRARGSGMGASSPPAAAPVAAVARRGSHPQAVAPQAGPTGAAAGNKAFGASPVAAARKAGVAAKPGAPAAAKQPPAAATKPDPAAAKQGPPAEPRLGPAAAAQGPGAAAKLAAAKPAPVAATRPAAPAAGTAAGARRGSVATGRQALGPVNASVPHITSPPASAAPAAAAVVKPAAKPAPHGVAAPPAPKHGVAARGVGKDAATRGLGPAAGAIQAAADARMILARKPAGAAGAGAVATVRYGRTQAAAPAPAVVEAAAAAAAHASPMKLPPSKRQGPRTSSPSKRPRQDPKPAGAAAAAPAVATAPRAAPAQPTYRQPPAAPSPQAAAVAPAAAAPSPVAVLGLSPPTLVVPGPLSARSTGPPTGGRGIASLSPRSPILAKPSPASARHSASARKSPGPRLSAPGSVPGAEAVEAQAAEAATATAPVAKLNLDRIMRSPAASITPNRRASIAAFAGDLAPLVQQPVSARGTPFGMGSARRQSAGVSPMPVGASPARASSATRPPRVAGAIILQGGRVGAGVGGLAVVQEQRRLTAPAAAEAVDATAEAAGAQEAAAQQPPAEPSERKLSSAAEHRASGVGAGKAAALRQPLSGRAATARAAPVAPAAKAAVMTRLSARPAAVHQPTRAHAPEVPAAKPVTAAAARAAAAAKAQAAAHAPAPAAANNRAVSRPAGTRHGSGPEPTARAPTRQEQEQEKAARRKQYSAQLHRPANHLSSPPAAGPKPAAAAAAAKPAAAAAPVPERQAVPPVLARAATKPKVAAPKQSVRSPSPAGKGPKARVSAPEQVETRGPLPELASPAAEPEPEQGQAAAAAEEPPHMQPQDLSYLLADASPYASLAVAPGAFAGFAASPMPFQLEGAASAEKDSPMAFGFGPAPGVAGGETPGLKPAGFAAGGFGAAGGMGLGIPMFSPMIGEVRPSTSQFPTPVLFKGVAEPAAEAAPGSVASASSGGVPVLTPGPVFQFAAVPNAGPKPNAAAPPAAKAPAGGTPVLFPHAKTRFSWDPTGPGATPPPPGLFAATPGLEVSGISGLFGGAAAAPHAGTTPGSVGNEGGEAVHGHSPDEQHSGGEAPGFDNGHGFMLPVKCSSPDAPVFSSFFGLDPMGSTAGGAAADGGMGMGRAGRKIEDSFDALRLSSMSAWPKMQPLEDRERAKAGL